MDYDVYFTISKSSIIGVEQISCIKLDEILTNNLFMKGIARNKAEERETKKNNFAFFDAWLVDYADFGMLTETVSEKKTLF